MANCTLVVLEKRVGCEVEKRLNSPRACSFDLALVRAAARSFQSVAVTNTQILSPTQVLIAFTPGSSNYTTLDGQVTESARARSQSSYYRT